MTDLADASLVIAAVDPTDALHERATRHIRDRAPFVVPFSVGIELLVIARRRHSTYGEALGAIVQSFLVEREDVLFTAAEALDSGEVPTVFDAIHLADAAVRGGSLHTADSKLLRTSFPTTPF